MSKVKILAIGEIIWDVYPDKKAIGGAPFNFAAHAVLQGAESTLISAVGKDALGTQAIEALKEFGIDHHFVQSNTYPTGQCIVTLDENAIPHYNVLREVSYDKITYSDEMLTTLENGQFDAFYFGTLIQRDAVTRQTVRELVRRCRFSNIVCDVNLRPDCYDAESVKFCLESATVLKVSLEEESLLREVAGYRLDGDTPEAIAKALCRAYPQLSVVIVTLGKDGSYAYCAADRIDCYQEAIGNKVVSTVGAGDSFTATWMTNYLQGKPLAECMKEAARISGIVVAHLPAVPKEYLK